MTDHELGYTLKQDSPQPPDGVNTTADSFPYGPDIARMLYGPTTGPHTGPVDAAKIVESIDIAFRRRGFIDDEGHFTDAWPGRRDLYY